MLLNEIFVNKEKFDDISDWAECFHKYYPNGKIDRQLTQATGFVDEDEVAEFFDGKGGYVIVPQRYKPYDPDEADRKPSWPSSKNPLK